MKAAILHGPYELEVQEVEKPTISDREVLVKVSACGICGSDLHMYKLGQGINDLWNMTKEELYRVVPQGVIMGHEWSGQIVEVGSQVEGFQVGDRVAGFGYGGYAEYVPMPDMAVVKLTKEVSYEEGATLEPLADALHIVNRGDPTQGESVMVYGLGIIGLGVVQCLKAIDPGLKHLIAVDISDKRLGLAKELGADACINARKEDPYKRAVEICGEVGVMYPFSWSTPAVDIVYDCAGVIKGSPGLPVIQQAMNIVRDRTGRIVCFGMWEEPVSLNFTPLVFKETKIVGSLGFKPSDVLEALQLMRTKKVDRRRLISHEFSLDNIKEAFETQLRAEGSLKVLVKP